jgi:hypothetical protein
MVKSSLNLVVKKQQPVLEWFKEIPQIPLASNTIQDFDMKLQAPVGNE